MSIEVLIAENTAALKAMTIAIQSLGGSLALGATGGEASTDKVKKVTYFNLVDKQQVVKVEAGGERPLGGLEVTAAEAKELDKKYKAGNAQNSQAGATGGQSSGSSGGSSSGTGTQSDSQSNPTFEDVTKAIQEVGKMPEVGRGKVVELLKFWGVEKFPMVSGKKPNADLLKDIAAAKAGTLAKPDDALDDLGI